VAYLIISMGAQSLYLTLNSFVTF